MNDLTTPLPQLQARLQPRVPVAALILGIVLAGALALIVTFVALTPTGNEMGDLAGLLVLSAAVSVLAYIAVERWLRSTPLVGLRGRLAVTAVFSGVLALSNVLITAGFMFLSSHDLTLLAVLIGFALCVSSFLGLAVARSISDPIDRLADAVDRLDGTYAIQAEPGGPPELARLTDAFNAMVQRLGAAAREREKSESARLELVAAISHDLRTPIASARLRLEAIEDGLLDDETQRSYLTNVQADLSRLSRLIDDLFEVSRIESGALQLKPVPTNLAVLAAEAIEGVRPQADHKGVKINSQVDPDLSLINLDPASLERALRNLLENAVRYTSDGGTVGLDVRPAGAHSVVLDVHDSGVGIASADAERIFEPFYRGDAARGRDGGGAGLGLAIARGLVAAHGGTLDYRDGAGGGSTFRITLPAAGLPETPSLVPLA